MVLTTNRQKLDLKSDRIVLVYGFSYLAYDGESSDSRAGDENFLKNLAGKSCQSIDFLIQWLRHPNSSKYGGMLGTMQAGVAARYVGCREEKDET